MVQLIPKGLAIEVFLLSSLDARVATNLENSGNLKNCQNLRGNSEKIEFLWEKTWKTQGK